MQAHIVLVLYENGRYEQSLFGTGADSALEDSGYYRISGGRLERITDQGGSLTERVDFEGEGFYLRMADDPFPEHPGRGPFKPLEDVEQSLRLGQFLLQSSQPARRTTRGAETAVSGGRPGFSRAGRQ